MFYDCKMTETKFQRKVEFVIRQHNCLFHECIINSIKKQFRFSNSFCFCKIGRNLQSFSTYIRFVA